MPPRASLARAALCAAALSVALLTLSAHSAWAQQPSKSKTPQTSTAPAKPGASAAATTTVVVCDSTAAPATTRKSVAARPHKPRPRRVVAAKAAAPVKRAPAVAHAKRRPRTRVEAGRHVASDPAARKAPPQCRTKEVAAAPQVGAVAELVNSLPWTAPAEETAFPMLTAPSLGEVVGGSGGIRAGTMLVGLLGAGALWFGADGETPPAVSVVPPGGEFPPPETVPPVTTVPEPATLLLVGTGLAAIGARSRRKRAEG